MPTVSSPVAPPARSPAATRRLLSRARAAPFVVFVVSALYLGALEWYFRPNTADGVHFQSWDSDLMEQTLPAEALKRTPIQSLWYLHIQPPMLDLVRAGLLLTVDGSGPELLRRLDQRMYTCYIVLYATLATLLWHWARRLGGVGFALAVWVTWLAHPAPILYATLLEGTFGSALLITWFLFELWLLSDARGSILRFAAACVLLFYTRTMFQWYFYPLVFASLVLLRVPWRQLIAWSAIVGVAVGALVTKQFILFHTTSTTTYGGYHHLGLIWHRPEKSEIARRIAELRTHYAYPEAADRYSGNDPLNTRTVAEENLVFMDMFREQIRSHPVDSLRAAAHSFKINAKDYWYPSTRYTGNVITGRLPATWAYEHTFKAWPYLLLMSGATVSWILRQRKTPRADATRRAVALALPIGFIMLISTLSNRYEWVGAVRFKFFLEPCFVLMLGNEGRELVRLWRAP